MESHSGAQRRGWGELAIAGVVFEVSTVIAMVVYALLGWVLERVVWVIFYRPSAETAVTKTTITNQRLP